MPIPSSYVFSPGRLLLRLDYTSFTRGLRATAAGNSDIYVFDSEENLLLYFGPTYGNDITAARAAAVGPESLSGKAVFRHELENYGIQVVQALDFWQYYQPTLTAVLSLVLLAAFVTVSGLRLSYVLAQNTARPFSVLVQRASQLGGVTPAEEPDEIARLSHIFEDLVEQQTSLTAAMESHSQLEESQYLLYLLGVLGGRDFSETVVQKYSTLLSRWSRFGLRVLVFRFDDTIHFVETYLPKQQWSIKSALRQEFEIVKPDLKSAGSQSLFVDQMITPAPQGFTSPARPSVEEAHPSLSLLDTPDPNGRKTDEESIQLTSRLIVAKLKSYNIDAEVLGAQPGPVITQYRLEPGPGVKGAQIESVRDDLRRALGVQAVRIVLSIPGTSCIGIEVPNPVRETVRLKEILKSEAYEKSTSALTLALGKDIAGHPVVIDLAKTPHLLVAGTTGSGKSVGINAMILSMLFRNSPKRLRLVLIDPKMLEFSLYNDILHLLTPVVTDMNKASAALKWLTNEMDRRYAVMSRVGVRQFSGFNEKVLEAEARGTPIRDPMAAKDDPAAPNLEPWPYIVCVVDELADLMLTNRKEVEGEITRLTQKARAAGIHLILATQRPSVDVVTSLIKANVPSRIAFQVASATDSRVILGESGAEQLLGNGDMLFHRPGAPDARRIQGCFVDDGEVQRVAEALRRQGSPSYVSGVTGCRMELGERSVGFP